MDRGRGKKRRNRGGGRGGSQDSSGQRGSPSPSPSPAAQQPKPQPQQQPKAPVKPGPMTTQEEKLPGSPAALGSDSEFLTPVSSPTGLLTPHPSPEKPAPKEFVQPEETESQPSTPQQNTAEDFNTPENSPISEASQPSSEASKPEESAPQTQPEEATGDTSKLDDTQAAANSESSPPTYESLAKTPEVKAKASQPESPAASEMDKADQQAAPVAEDINNVSQNQADQSSEIVQSASQNQEATPKAEEETSAEVLTSPQPAELPVIEAPSNESQKISPPLEPEVKIEEIRPPVEQVPIAQLIAVQTSDNNDKSAPNTPAPTEPVTKEAGPVKSTVKIADEARKMSKGAEETTTGGGGEKGEGKKGSGRKSDEKATSLEMEIEQSQGSLHDIQETLLTGKPRYFGGTAGLGEHTTATACDSDDSLLTGDRRSGSSGRPSVSTGSGWMGFSKRQVLTLLVFSVADFFSAIIISLQGPFYPKEAETKGASATEYGLVFGVFELVVFISSPIYGKYLHRIGPKYVFNTGIVVTAAATVAFGFLDRIDDRTTFVAASFAVRIVEALGDAAFVTASFAIIAAEFPDSVATTFASLETFFGLGLIVGPTLGGALFEKGGFTLPFVVMGGLLFGVGIFTFLLMPKITHPIESDKDAPKGMLDILKVPAVLLAALAIANGSITIGFLNSTLEPHIREFGLNGVLTGLIFVINGGVYAVSAPAWGWLCDRVLQPKYTGLIGVITIFIAFLLIGPAPFIPLDTTLYMVALGLIIHGLGLGAALVSSFVMALKESINHGFADNIQTYGLTSALWTSSFALGAFIGPSVSGILFDYAGFRWATVFVLAWEVIMTILLTTHIVRSRHRGGFSMRNLSESQPLLQSEDPCTSKTALQRQDKKDTGGYGAMA